MSVKNPESFSKRFSFGEAIFVLIQTLKFCLMKFLTFHFRKVETGVLLIRQDNLGDFLISLPIFEQIAGSVHGEKKTVTIVVSRSMESFCSSFPFFDHVIALPQNPFGSFLKRVKSYRRITACSPEKTLLFHILGRSGEHDYMALLPASRERYAMEIASSWPLSPVLAKYRTLFFNRKYTRIVPYDPGRTLLQNEIALAQCAMDKPIAERLGNIRCLYPLPACEELKGPYYLIVPGSSSPVRQWPAEKFASLLDLLSSDFPELTPVLAGSKQDCGSVRQVLEKCRNSHKAVDLCGKTSLKELFGIIENAKFLVTNDTGPYHMAPLVNTRTYCISGNWHYGAYGPSPIYSECTLIRVETPCKRCLENCPFLGEGKIYPCLLNVTVPMVREIILQGEHARRE